MNYAQIQMSPKYRRWTVGAAECYKRGGVCRGCEMFELTSGQCRMKASVISLVKHCGPPPENIETQDFEIQERCIGKDKKDMIKINATGNKVYDADIDYQYGKSYAPIIEAIKKGFTTNSDIAKETGIDKNYLSVKYRNFCTTLKSKSLINDSNVKTHLEKVVEFVQDRLKKSENKNKPVIKIESDTDNLKQRFYMDVNGLNNIKELENQLNTIAEIDKVKQLEEENQKLRDRITELESQPKTGIDFSAVKEKLTVQIAELNAKLQAVDLLEKELTP